MCLLQIRLQRQQDIKQQSVFTQNNMYEMEHLSFSFTFVTLRHFLMQIIQNF